MKRSRPSIKIAGWSRSFSKITSFRLRTGLGSRGSKLPAPKESAESALAVMEAGWDGGVDRMVVTHAQFEVVNMSFEQMKKVASMGAKLELCAMGPLMGPEAHLEWMRHWRRVKVEETAAAVKEVGAENSILATDLGQTGNPSPADGLQLFVTDLMKAGLTKDQITTMGREVTGKLLMG